MKNPEVLIVEPQNKKQLNAIKAFMLALQIDFKISRKNDYNSDFVDEVLKARKEAKDGKVTRIKKENLQKLLGL